MTKQGEISLVENFNSGIPDLLSCDEQQEKIDHHLTD